MAKSLFPAPLASSASSVLGPFLALAVVLAVGVPAFFGWQIQRAGSLGFWLLVIVPTVVVAAGAVIRAHRDGELRDWVKPRWGDATAGVLGGLVLSGAAYLFTRTVAPLHSPREAWLARLYLQIGDPTELRQQTTLVAAVLIVASVAEELVWRGLVTTLLAERWGSRAAWLVSALLYALAHLPAAWALADAHAGPNWLLPAGALGAGLVWGAMVRLKGGSLAPAMIAHALFDWVIVMTFRLWGAGL
ncbi:MAG TPA: type II CAAX endopeptidase family protein [Polyangiaceae bacterium]|nr:type II CAAX endopeptidase family protein [Polyangiaceae bacterium]